MLKIKRIVVTITGLGTLFLQNGWRGLAIKKIVGFFYKNIINQPDIKVIFQNQDDRELFISNGWVANNQSKIILGTGVDTDVFQPTNSKSEIPKIIFPARFLKDKGIFELISAAEILNEEGLEFQIILCGELDPGNPSSISIEELRNLTQYKYVDNRGYCSDMASIYREGHIVCLPSYREGVPLSLIEAAASGLPIVTTDAPGCREVVQDGNNGFLVPVKNVIDLANKLKLLVQSKTLREEMGHKSRAWALKVYEKQLIVNQNLELYEDDQICPVVKLSGRWHLPPAG